MRERLESLTLQAASKYAGDGDIFMPGAVPSNPELPNGPKNTRPAPEGIGPPTGPEKPPMQQPPNGKEQLPQRRPESRSAFPENDTHKRLEEMTKRVGESDDPKKAIVEELLRLPQGAEVSPEDELFRQSAARALYEFADRHGIDKREVVMEFMKEAERLMREGKFPGQETAEEHREEGKEEVKGKPKRKNPLKGFRKWLKEKRRRRKEKKEEKSRRKIFRLFDKTVRQDIATNIPGIDVQSLHLDPYFHKAYFSTFEKSGIIRERAFRHALEHDPQIGRLFRQEMVKDVLQEQQGPAPSGAGQGKRAQQQIEQAGSAQFAEELKQAGFTEEQIAKTPPEVLAAMRQQREAMMQARAQSGEVIQAAGAEFDVLNQAAGVLPTYATIQLDTARITNDRLRAIAEVYNNDVLTGNATYDNIADIRDLVRQVVAEEPSAADQAKEILNVLNAEYRRVYSNLQREQELRQRSSTDILGNLTDEDGNPLTLQRILVDRRMRDMVFNDLYSLVNSRAHELWQEAWNPLSQGIREENFFSLVQGQSAAPREEVERFIGNEELSNYMRIHLDEFSQRFGRPLAVDVEYQGLASQDEKNEVIDAAKEELRRSFEGYKKESQIRKTLHNINAVIYRTSIKPDQFFGFIQDYNGEMADFTNSIYGVREMMDIYEEQVRLAMLEHDGYLRPEDVTGSTEKVLIKEKDKSGKVRELEVDRRIKAPKTEEIAKQVFHDMYKKGMIFVRSEDGTVVDMKKALGGASELQPWELDSILTHARGNMIANQRLISLAAESRLPRGMTTRFGSLFLQDILQSYSPNIHLNTKYWAPGYKTSSFLMWGEDRDKWEFADGGIKIRKPWQVNAEFKRYKKWKEHTIEYALENEKIEANRQNPNRGGDAFTRIYAWKVGLNAGEQNESITRDFLERGYNRMIELYAEKNVMHPDFQQILGNNIVYDGTARIFRAKLKDIDYVNFDEYGKPAEKGHHPEGPTLNDIVATNLYIYKNGRAAFTPDKFRQIKEMSEGLNEYGNWVGTAIQLELLHGDLDDYGTKAQKKGAEKARRRGNKIVARMVELQPDRLFLISRHIQKRVLNDSRGLRKLWEQESFINGIFDEKKFTGLIRQTTGDLKMLQEDLLRQRDELIERGESFYGGGLLGGKKVALDLSKLDALIEAERPVKQLSETDAAYNARVVTFENEKVARKRRVEQFMAVIKDDYEKHKSPWKKGAKTEKYTSYEDEFVTYKDFYHGFVLWTGDAPMEEFKMAAVGTTGAFARAAGNNLLGIKIAEGMTKLMSGNKNARSPEQVVGLISPIYAGVNEIDHDLANTRVMQIADNCLKWFSADWRSSLPFYNWIIRWGGRASYAQKMYGKRMPVWYANEKRDFLDRLKEQGYISLDQFHELVDRHSVRYWRDLPYHSLKTLGELAIAFFIFYVIKKALEKE